MKALVAIAALAMAGCTTTPADTAPPATGSIETIRYETGPCFGTCPVYVLSVSSDGHATFEGRQHTAKTGVQEFTVTPAQFEAFASRLAPYRPAGERRLIDAECNGRMATDLGSADISWSGKGPNSHLYAYYGCDMERNAAMFKAVREAPDTLPIQGFIGAR